MRPSLRRAQVRDARSIPAALDGAPDGDRNTSGGGVRLLEAATTATGAIGRDRNGRVDLRVRPHPADLRLRRQLPDPEVPAGSEHRDAERVDLRRRRGGAPGAELGGGVQGWFGLVGGLPGVEPELVDHSGGPISIHRDEPAVPVHVDRLQLASVCRPARVLPALDGVGGDALPGDVVLPDHGLDCWSAEGSSTGPGFTHGMHDDCRVGVHDLGRLQCSCQLNLHISALINLACTGHMGRYAWRNTHADLHFDLGYFPHGLEQRGTYFFLFSYLVDFFL
ncbi:hypothetical protein B296_00010874 [Ensete ventricosum]|uniref:Uncharacterized protein n=1 Tax=Ensete ventricosum TaxID=4639 RepID=A0A427A8M0_ENSVE|nr:hypothetical protein B296_00010874 [Ensete ventricosum]